MSPIRRGREPGAEGRRGAAVVRRTVTELAVEALRQRILHGELREGTPLRQDALAAQLGMSRIPVREALRQLEAEGLVTFSPHCGAIVSTLSLGDVGELFDLRAMIEADLLRRAAPRLELADVRRAKEILEAYEIALAEGRVAEWGELNWRFHATLLEPAARPLTMGVLRNLHDQSDRYMRMQLSLTHGETRANDEHRAILAAVASGDAARASQLLSAHILGAGAALLEFLRVERGR
jgi:DNA-binding GntR family transcriptional regulator